MCLTGLVCLVCYTTSCGQTLCGWSRRRGGGRLSRRSSGRSNASGNGSSKYTKLEQSEQHELRSMTVRAVCQIFFFSTVVVVVYVGVFMVLFTKSAGGALPRYFVSV